MKTRQTNSGINFKISLKNKYAKIKNEKLLSNLWYRNDDDKVARGQRQSFRQHFNSPAPHEVSKTSTRSLH